MEIIIDIAVGILGTIFLTLFNAKDYIIKNDKTFSWKLHMKENWIRWAWSVSMIIVLAVIIHIEPKTAEGIKAFTGLDISGERASFFTVGLVLIAMIKKKK